MFYKLFSNSIPVKGYFRSVIIDIQRQDYTLIPNDLFEILTKFENKSIEFIQRYYNNEYDNIITEYFKFLYDKEIIFWVNSEQELENFPEINFDFNTPFKITNAIIDIENEMFLTADIAKQLDNLNIQNLQIRIFSSVSISELKDIYNLFNETIITNIEFVITYSANYAINNIRTDIENLPKLTRLVICSSPQNELIKISQQRDILYFKNECNSSEKCGQIRINNTNINYKFYSESINYNTCLNGKISIDANGLIKNCPSCKKDYGNILENKLDSVINNKEFRKIWDIKKDDIDVCRDCEFRHICIDCRAFIKDSKNIYSQPSKCDYNPYIGKWKGEENWISVEHWLKENSDLKS